MSLKDKLKRIDWPLVSIPLISVIILNYMIEKYPRGAQSVISAVRQYLNNDFTLFYIFVALFFFGSTIYIACSKYGRIKLGDPDSKPEYSNLRWGIMIFTSTMSADIIFYSLCEWMMYSREPFIAQKPSVLEWSLTYSLFHWGPIAWSFYIMLAVAFGYMLYVTKNTQQKFSEACRPLLGRYVDGFWGKVIDLVAVFSLVAATATTFSVSMPLISTVVGSLTGFHNIKALSVILILVVVSIYLVASVMGMKAISVLSIVCYTFFIALLLYIFSFSGETVYIVSSGVKTCGNLVQNFLWMATQTNTRNFTQHYTVYYWSYWIVWCVATPFFIGSISKGRQIRDVIWRGYAWGLSGTFLSFIILSSFGISRQINHLVDATKLVASGQSYSEVILRLLETLPQYRIALFLLIFAMIGLYSTVFDSITMVVSKYSYRNLKVGEEPSKLMRGFWALAFMILPLALLISGSSIYCIQSVAIIVAFPTAIVITLIVVGFYCDVVKMHETLRISTLLKRNHKDQVL